MATMLEIQNARPVFVPVKSKIERTARGLAFQKRVRNRIALMYSIEKTGQVDILKIDNLLGQFTSGIANQIEWVKNTDIEQFGGLFGHAAGNLLKLSPARVSVEITSANSIYFFSQIGEDKIHLEIFFDPTSGKHTKSVVNIFSKKQQQLSDSGRLTELFTKIEAFFNRPSFFTNDLSQNAYSTTAF